MNTQELREQTAAKLDSASAESSFLATHIITSSPWGAAAADPAWPIAHTLGTLFDKDINARMAARMADEWAIEAFTILGTVCMGWWKLLTPAARRALEEAHFHLPAIPVDV